MSTTAPEVISLGEALIDFVPEESGLSLSEVSSFHKRLGGAPANVAIGLSTLGCSTGFIGKVGMDGFGDFIERKFKSKGVNTDQLYRTGRANTTLAFVSIDETGEREFIFYRNPGADELLHWEEIDYEFIGEAKLFHFGSLSLTGKQSREATVKSLECAQDHGLIITMDPNVRLSLWNDPPKLKKLIRDLLSKVNILKLSAEEAKFLSGKDKLTLATEKLIGLGPDIVIVTLGKEGCFFRDRSSTGKIEGLNVEVRDTTGAGDAFLAGFIFKFLRSDSVLSNIDSESLHQSLQFGNVTGALTTRSHGATSAFPDSNEVERLSKKKDGE